MMLFIRNVPFLHRPAFNNRFYYHDLSVVWVLYCLLVCAVHSSFIRFINIVKKENDQ